MEIHFKTKHNNYDTNYPIKSDLRAAKLKKLKENLSAQQLIFTKSTAISQAATMASYRVFHILAKKNKSFSDGAIFKQAFLEAVDSLFGDFKNKSDIVTAINNMQLTRNTVTRRVDELSSDLQEQLMQDINSCQALSLQLDESIDAVDISQLIIYIRMVFKNFSSKEELFTIIPLKGTTRGQDIFDAFKEYIKDISLPIHKLVSITTDGVS